MQTPAPSPLPPHVLRYRSGAAAQTRQFAFLIGEWSVQGLRYAAGGAPPFGYRARWRAEYLHERRVVLDDFTFLSSEGEELSAFVTLRTYAPEAGCWSIAGLAAMEAGWDGKWNGVAVDDEMHLEGELRTQGGARLRHRERFHAITERAFQWESHHRLDDGDWTLVSRLEATRLS